MKKKHLLRLLATATGLGMLFSSLLHAGTITHWDMNNVTVTPPPYAFEQIYDSTLFTDGSKTTSYGAVYWKEADGVQAPGMQIVNDDVITGDNCIMTSGYNPKTGAAKSCSDEFQGSKRWKLKTTDNKPVDVYFSVNDDRTRQTYRSIQKLSNATAGRLKGFTMELGFMVNGEFVPATDGDGLGFSQRRGRMFEGTVSYDPNNPNPLSAFFPFDIAGEPDQWHDEPGYFIPDARMYIDLEATQNKITSTGISQNHLDILGDWHNAAGVPVAMFFDDGKSHPELMAHCEWSYDSETLACLGEWITYRSCTELDADNEPCDSDGIRKRVPQNVLDQWFADANYVIDYFDDVANVTLNYYITVDRRLNWPTPGQFVLRTITIPSDRNWDTPGNSDNTGTPGDPTDPGGEEPPIIENDIDVTISDVVIPRLRRGASGTISVTLNNQFAGTADGTLNLEVRDQSGNLLDSYAIGFTTAADSSATTLEFVWTAPSYRTTVTATATAIVDGDIDPDNNTASATQRIR